MTIVERRVQIGGCTRPIPPTGTALGRTLYGIVVIKRVEGLVNNRVIPELIASKINRNIG